MKKSKILFALFLVCFFLINASWKDMEKKINEKTKLLEEKYQKHSRMLDEKFAKTLSEEWFEAKFKEPEKLFKEPKPEEIPPAPEEKPKVPDSTPVVVPVLPAVVPLEKPKPAPVKETRDEVMVKVDFFNRTLEIPVPEAVKKTKAVQLKNKAIADYWKNVSSINHKNTLARLEDLDQSILINDWAYLMFVQRLCREVYPDRPDLQNLYTWFLLIRTGYQARIGYDEKRIYLLLPATTQLYGKTFFKFKDEKFYRLSALPDEEKMGSVYTYPEAYPEANKKLELRVKEWPSLPKEMKKKKLAFGYRGDTYRLSVQYDQSLVEFTRDYPQTTIDAYTKAPFSDSSGENMTKKLSALVKGKRETEAADILLAFVQKAFAYKTDDEQFGREKWLFAEETLHYPYSDCEDRSVIFARLVTELMGLRVVMLHYPGHMATAVLFSEKVEGDSVKYRGQTYTVCDPTYINSAHGQAMPQFKKAKPEIMEF